jgi:hypothetical protein
VNPFPADSFAVGSLNPRGRGRGWGQIVRLLSCDSEVSGLMSELQYKQTGTDGGRKTRHRNTAHGSLPFVSRPRSLGAVSFVVNSFRPRAQAVKKNGLRGTGITDQRGTILKKGAGRGDAAGIVLHDNRLIRGGGEKMGKTTRIKKFNSVDGRQHLQSPGVNSL